MSVEPAVSDTHEAAVGHPDPAGTLHLKEEQVDWIGVGCALLGALLFALLAIQTRRMSASESSELMVFYAALAFLAVTGGLLLLRWDSASMDDIVFMLGLGCVTLLAQYTIVSSYQFAAVYVLAPFEYVTILWAVCLGYLFFDDVPTPVMLMGATLVVICGLAIVYLERRAARGRP